MTRRARSTKRLLGRRKLSDLATSSNTPATAARSTSPVEAQPSSGTDPATLRITLLTASNRRKEALSATIGTSEIPSRITTPL